MATASESDVPRSPSAYRPTVHFTERFKDRYNPDTPSRYLDGDIVEGCIRRGTLTRKHATKVFFRETFAGVTYRLVANPRAGTILTGYPIGIDPAQARDSGRWSEEQIADIKAGISEWQSERDSR